MYVPRLKEETRLARRREIAEAALRCFARQGFAATSMADIIAESGLSAGSIYSHYDSKAALVHEAAKEILDDRFRQVVAAIDLDGTATISPGRLFLAVVETMFVASAGPVLLRVWAEMPVDPELAAVGVKNVGFMRARVSELLVPWVGARAGAELTADDPLVGRTADLVIAAVQGLLVRAAFDEPDTLAALRQTLARALDTAEV